MATKTYKSEPMAAVHEMMEGLRQGGAIEERTMREFDAACYRRRHSRHAHP
jgi:putative transcriptional regulator